MMVYGQNTSEVFERLQMVVITAAPTPHRFHFAAMWRGSSGLGKIRESMLAQFPSGLRSLQVPCREWSSFTKLRLCAFDLYNMSITHMKWNVLSQKLFGQALHLSECNGQINGTHSLLCDLRRDIDFSLWCLPHAGRYWGSPWQI